MATSEFLIIAGMIMVGLIFLLAAQSFISGGLTTTQESMYRQQAEEIVSLIQRTTAEQGNYFYYYREINPSSIGVKDGILTFQKDKLTLLYPVPKQVIDTNLNNTASICVLKRNDVIKVLDKCPKCDMNSLCTPDECKEDCPDCYGPDSTCVGDGFCNKAIGENCETSIDCPCTTGKCCPASPDADFNGCTNTSNIGRGNQCWCTSQCQTGLDCNPTAPNFLQYKRACCDPGEGWNGTDCVKINCPANQTCPGAPMNGGPGDNAWVDINNNVCCPFDNIDDTSGPICSAKHCCPTHKPRWCDKPKTGSPRCMDQTEYQAEGCSPTIPCDSIHSDADLPSSWDWHNLNNVNWLPPIRDQGHCGSCWAHSAVGAVEGNYNIERNLPSADTDLSEQDLVSCEGTGGCSGDWEDHALSIIQNSGICDEACFRYQAADIACNRCNDFRSRLWKITGYAGVSSNFEIKKALVCKGPLAIDLTFLPHAVVLVGYGNNQWIIRNSWGVINGNRYGINHVNGYGYMSEAGTIGGSFKVLGVIPPS